MESDYSQNPLIKIDMEEFAEIKRQADEYKLMKEKALEFEELRQKAKEYMLIKQNAGELDEIKKQAEEYQLLKQEVTQCKIKINNLTKARVNKRSKEEMAYMEEFFQKFIVKKKEASIKTVDVMTKANEFLANKSLRFNKFEVAQFMKEKGILKKKAGGHTYYIDIKFAE